MPETLFDRHRPGLEAAVAACASREYFSAFDESPSPRVYGEDAAGRGKAAFEGWLGGAFPLSTRARPARWRPSARRTASIWGWPTRGPWTSTP